MLKIIGSPVSPFVRKVLALLHLKGVAFEVDPITPFFGNDEFTKLSPLRQVPVLIHGDVVVNDSAVIANYIEETWPEPAMLPTEPAARAEVRWWDQYANSRLADVFLFRCFSTQIVAPFVLKTEPDEAAFKETLSTDVVEIMDFLESKAPSRGFWRGDFSLADISMASFFWNMRYVKWAPDAARWPMTAAWLERANAEPVMELTNKWSDILLTARRAERHQLASEAGLTLTQDTIQGCEPKRGPMTPGALS